MTQVIHVRDEKSTGTFGDTYTGGVETAHTLNTVKTNTIVGASLSSNQVTLPPGDYLIEGYCSQPLQGRLSIYNATAGAYVIHGIPNSVLAGPASGSHKHLSGVVSLQDTSNIELHIRPTNTTATSPVSYGSDPEVYAELIAITL